MLVYEAGSRQREPGSMEQAIRLRAYEYFLERRALGLCGDAVSDWLRAERAIADEQCRQSSAGPRIRRGGAMRSQDEDAPVLLRGNGRRRGNWGRRMERREMRIRFSEPLPEPTRLVMTGSSTWR